MEEEKMTFNETLAARYTTINNAVNNEKEPPKKIVKKSKIKREAEIPKQRYSDFGGIESAVEEIRRVMERPFRHPEVYRHLGVDLPRGVLLYGPPGCGKTGLALAIAGELGIPLIKIAAPELVSGMSGESEERIRELFGQARKEAPCLVFIDEIDAITPKRENAQREMERRMVAQLLTCLDELSGCEEQVMVIGATNRPEALDPGLRRAGRFDKEIKLGVPDEQGRLDILRVVCGRLRLAQSLDLGRIARNTPGYVGADLKALAQEAASVAVTRIFGKDRQVVLDDSVAIEAADFELALATVQPSAKREGFAVVPNISWADVGALSRVRDELRMAVIEPLRHPEKFAAAGVSAPAGVLLWGPPGCGKTLLARAVANESHSNFISVKGPELLNKWLGESERAVRQVFERARTSAPCVVFFDELDALCPRRGDNTDSSSARVVNQLLTELDGLEGRGQVFVLAATNRPDIIDPAMTRPGRLDKLLYVPLPTKEDRIDILKTLGRKTPWHPSVCLEDVAVRCEGFSGADLSALVREASLSAIRESLDSMNQDTPLTVSLEHVEIALSKVSPSVK